MTKTFKLKGIFFKFLDEDVKQAAAELDSGTRDRVRFYVKVENLLYPARQILVEMIKRKGTTMPDVTTHQATNVLRSLGFEITEV